MKHFIFTTRQHVMEDVSLKVSESEAEKIFDNDLAEELLLGKLDDRNRCCGFSFCKTTLHDVLC